MPPGQGLDLAFALFHREGGIAARVKALLRMSAPLPADALGSRWRGTAVGLAIAGVAFLLLAGSPAAALPIHRALEVLVHLLA